MITAGSLNIHALFSNTTRQINKRQSRISRGIRAKWRRKQEVPLLNLVADFGYKMPQITSLIFSQRRRSLITVFWRYLRTARGLMKTLPSATTLTKNPTLTCP